MKSKKNNKTLTPLEKDMDGIKRLLILALLKSGTKQGEIAMALGVDQGDLSRAFPSRKIRLFKEKAKD